MKAITTTWLLAALIAGCADQGGLPVNESLDPVTAVTVRSAGTAVIYAHDRPAAAANARDYLSAGLVEVDNMGNRLYYLALVSWSTVDHARAGVDPPAAPGPVSLTLAGRTRELTPVEGTPRAARVSLALFRPSTGFRAESWYPLAAEDLRAWRTASPPEVVVEGEAGVRTRYTLWQDAAATVKRFVDETPLPASSGKDRAPR